MRRIVVTAACFVFSAALLVAAQAVAADKPGGSDPGEQIKEGATKLGQGIKQGAINLWEATKAAASAAGDKLSGHGSSPGKSSQGSAPQK